MRPHAAEDPGDFWRRMHRDGHCLMFVDGGGVDFRRRCCLHSFAGHLARSNEGRLNEALRTRGLAWWRAMQVQGLFPHPARFKAWRWEEQLEEFYGKSRSIFIDENTGWMLLAQDRTSWKALETQFARSP